MKYLLTMIALFAVAGFWLAGLRARERATAVTRAHCLRFNLQLLDDTVALTRLRPVLDRGRFKWLRRYDFEFTETGDLRRQGKIVLLGLDIQDLALDPHQIPG